MYNNNAYPYQFFNMGAQLPKQEVVRVNGKNGAEAYQMAPNSSVLLLDETAPIIWLKTTDGASYPTITGYSISPIQPKVEQPTNELYLDLEKRIAKIEETIKDVKSYTGSTKPKAPKEQ